MDSHSFRKVNKILIGQIYLKSQMKDILRLIQALIEAIMKIIVHLDLQPI